MKPGELMKKAQTAAMRAYAPYSNFRVGAAVELENGNVVTGVNVENRSYGLTLCAERTAICSAVSQGQRRIAAIAVAGLDAKKPLSPCGACRQVLSEFCHPDTPLYFDNGADGYIVSSVGELFPHDALHDLREP